MIPPEGCSRVAALFVQEQGVYFRDGVDPWTEGRDARTYPGPYPVVAHPPCASWGQYAKLTPDSRARGPLLGDDGGCFASALASVRRWGGVLEHPRFSKAFGRYGISEPDLEGWKCVGDREWVCLVDQGNYGHRARKPTWLFYKGSIAPPDLTWGPSSPLAIGTGARRGNVETMSKRERAATPKEFADLLIFLASFPLPPGA